MPSWHRLLWQCRQWPVSAAVSEHTVPKNYLKYKNKTGKEALPFITEFLETTECLGDAWDWDRAPEKVWFRSLLPNYKWLHGKQRGWRYPRENTSTEKQSCLHKQLWEGDAELAQGGHAACERRGSLSSRSGDLGLSSSWSLVNYTHDLEIKCAKQMRDHPPVIHRATGKSKPCTWVGLCQVRADYKMSPDDEAFSLIPSANNFQRTTSNGDNLAQAQSDSPVFLYRLHTSAALAVCLETYLRPYSLQMAVFCAMLISISSDRLCFQCRRSESFSASISLLAVFPAKALCWTRDCIPREARY